jgi:hypothetical protein
LSTVTNKIISWWYGGMVASDSTFHHATILPSFLMKITWWSSGMENFIMINLLLIETMTEETLLFPVTFS